MSSTMLYSNLMLAIVLLSALSLETQADEQCPNVALFLVDDFGWQDLKCWLGKASLGHMLETGSDNTKGKTNCR